MGAIACECGSSLPAQPIRSARIYQSAACSIHPHAVATAAIDDETMARCDFSAHSQIALAATQREAADTPHHNTTAIAIAIATRAARYTVEA